MHCPFCQELDTKVIDSRSVSEGLQTRRRRECLGCGERFTTYEIIELSLPRIRKKDDSFVAFDEEKLRAGILRALEKRLVKMEEVDKMVTRIINRLRGAGDREIPSQQIGEWVMQELKGLDQVAYVRFASVYRRFEDVEAFRDEIAKLKDTETT